MVDSVKACEAEVFPTDAFNHKVVTQTELCTLYKFTDGSLLYDFHVSGTKVATNENLATRATKKWGKISYNP
jgi:hypothetical protein